MSMEFAVENYFDRAEEALEKPDDERQMWVDQPTDLGKVSMAFAPAPDAPTRVLHARSLAWTKPFAALLLEYRSQVASARRIKKIELPYGELRGAFHCRLPALLRLDTRMGLSYLNPQVDQAPFALLSERMGSRESFDKLIKSCLVQWADRLFHFAEGDAAALATLNSLMATAKTGQAHELRDLAVHTLPWQPNKANTAASRRDGDNSKFSYAGLVEEAAIALVGKELLPGTGALRRVLDTDPVRNRSTLLTPPIVVEGGEFSFCITLHVETVPSVPQPLIVFDVSRRRWIGGALKRKFGARTIKGHVFSDLMPDRVMTFQADRKTQEEGIYKVETDAAFDYITAAHHLPLGLNDARKIASGDYDVDGNSIVRLVYSNGITEKKHVLDVGVPERDWVEAMTNAATILQDIGLVPFKGFVKAKAMSIKAAKANKGEAPSADVDADAAKPEDEADERRTVDASILIDVLAEQFADTPAFEARYGFIKPIPQTGKPSAKQSSLTPPSKDPHTERALGLQRLEDVCRVNSQAIAGLNAQNGIVLVLIYDAARRTKGEVNLVEDIARTLFGTSLEIARAHLPENVHGHKSWLPGNDLKSNEDRFALRVDSWKSLTADLREYLASGKQVYCLVMADEWYPPKATAAAPANGKSRDKDKVPPPLHDDPVNKAAARNALITQAHACSQYLLPLQFKDGAARIGDFSQRVQSALKDLLLSHNGAVLPYRGIAAKYFGATTPPKEIIGFTVIRSQSGRVNASDPSFVLAAFKQSLETGHCQMRFAYDRNGKFENSLPWMDMQLGLATLAKATPCWLSNETNANMRAKVNRERYQAFVRGVIEESNAQDTNALVMIDSTNAAGLWSWLTDQNISGEGIDIANATHIEEVWQSVRIVRVRQGLAPLIVENRYKTFRNAPDGDVMQVVPTPSKTQGVFRVGDAAPSGAPIAYWSQHGIKAKLKTGSSCYRQTVNTNEQRASKQPGYKVVKSKPAFVGQWPSPNAVEFVVGLMHNGDVPDNIALFCHELREMALHYLDSTALPVPLYFENVARQYIARFALAAAESDADADSE